jgi:hypothetical protein
MSNLSNTTLSSISAHGLKLDRLLKDKISLPYDIHDLMVKPNDVVTSHTVNKMLYKIDKNFSYIIRSSQIANNKIPYNPKSIRFKLSKSKTSSAYHVSYESDDMPKQNWNAVSIKDMLLVNVQTVSSVGIVVADKYNIILGKLGQDRSTNFAGSSDLYSSNKIVETSTGTFNNIISISYNNDNLYVLDFAKNTSPGLHQYNISGITNDDKYGLESPTKGRRHVRSIGGAGRVVEDTVSLKNPRFVHCDDSSVYIVDTEDDTKFGGYIKEYDLNLNFIALHDLTVHFKKYAPVSILKDKDTLLILANEVGSNRGYIIVYDKIKRRVTKNILLEDTFVEDTKEPFTSITQAPLDKNILYICSREKVIKKFKSRIDKTIGTFKFTPVKNGEQYIAGNLVDDELAVVCPSGFYLFAGESTDYKSVIYETTDASLIPITSIYVKPEEYVNHFTFNKCFKKLVYNHLYIRENIRNEITGSISDNELEMKYIHPKSSQITNLYAYEENLNNYVGINEPITTSTINRCISEVYKLQLLLVENLKADI